MTRTIADSRRAMRTAMAKLWELMRDGAVMEWPDDPPPEAEPTITPSTSTPAVHLRDSPLNLSKRESTPRTALRLITPRSVKESPESFKTAPADL